MKFYLPNFDDFVDPEYDFINDRPSPNRHDRFTHDWFIHRFFTAPPFDGVLISKTVVKPKMEKYIRHAGGVHAFLKLDKNIPVMGDCGAFSYRLASEPPYDVEEILEYYDVLGVDYGVSVDHIIFPQMGETEKRRRFHLTLENARKFLKTWSAGKYRLKPVGIAQGWDAASRREAIERLLEMGYRHLALGGMARSSNEEVLETLEAIYPVLPDGVTLHVFGVARIELVADFIRLGVTSVDSAAPLRRAFLGSNGDNYWTRDGKRYAAIRIPEARRKGRKKRGIDSTEEVMQKNGISIEALKDLEQKALSLLRAYDAGQASIEETLQAVLTYDRLHGESRNLAEAYRRTLQDRPWQSCNCPICKSIGVEVIIFRGRNRNQRRGFHNVRVFYEQFREAVRKYSYE